MSASDDETVAALAAFIDDFYEPDEHDKTTSDSMDSEASSPPVSRAVKPKRTTSKKPQLSTPARLLSHNRTRERQRDELLRLRDEEKKLRAKLLELVMVKVTRSIDKEEHRMRDPQVLVSMWKEVATRQHKRRSIAEAENSRLRDRLMDQQRVIKSLQRVIASQLTKSSNPSTDSRLYCPAWRSICAAEDPARRVQLFTGLAGQLQQIYAASDYWVRASQELTLKNGPHIESRVVPLTSSHVAVETINVRLLPFNYHVAGNAYFSRGINQLCAISDFFRDHATVEGKHTVFTAKAFADESDVSDNSPGVRLRAHATGQSFVEADRFVIASASRSEFVHIGREYIPDVALDEQYWNIFCPSDDSPLDACVMMCFGRVILDLESGLARAPHAVPVLTKYFGTRMHHHLGMSVEMMEDWILDEKMSVRVSPCQFAV